MDRSSDVRVMAPGSQGVGAVFSFFRMIPAKRGKLPVNQVGPAAGVQSFLCTQARGSNAGSQKESVPKISREQRPPDPPKPLTSWIFTPSLRVNAATGKNGESSRGKCEIFSTFHPSVFTRTPCTEAAWVREIDPMKAVGVSHAGGFQLVDQIIAGRKESTCKRCLPNRGFSQILFFVRSTPHKPWSNLVNPGKWSKLVKPPQTPGNVLRVPLKVLLMWNPVGSTLLRPGYLVLRAIEKIPGPKLFYEVVHFFEDLETTGYNRVGWRWRTCSQHGLSLLGSTTSLMGYWRLWEIGLCAMGCVRTSLGRLA
uniref:Uncharacterized protein n=1 Tax=Fagus sylvatica TaxID=28930 RepID=A0A2N9F2V4_FAGSY